ncbi:helix-turn-helix transcriptional regulator [Enterococcus sp. AZ196]|uniref:helix-turn-helix transcriptional regulator n=1 Tax=Enterococcus sp. AZ196 TaxID=2774659 RepID=UPI003D2B4A0F
MDHFVLDKVLFSKEEQESLLLALKGIKAIEPEKSEQAYSKLQSLFKLPEDNWLEVDFSPWYQENEGAQFDRLKSGILNRKKVAFEYISQSNQREKRVCNPLKLIFKSQTWYLQAFCLSRKDFRVFKISRMQSLKIMDETFTPMVVPEIAVPEREGQRIELTLAFSKEILYRVFDDFDHQDITIQKDGSAIVTTQVTDQRWLIRQLLSYGKHLKILSPDSIKERMKHEIEEIRANYDF